jgi:hypothetical protein
MIFFCLNRMFYISPEPIFLRRIWFCSQKFEIEPVAPAILGMVLMHVSKMGIHNQIFLFNLVPQIFRRIQIWGLFGHICPIAPDIIGFLKIATKKWAPDATVQPGIGVKFWSRFRIWSPFFHIWSGSHDIANILILLKIATKSTPPNWAIWSGIRTYFSRGI